MKAVSDLSWDGPSLLADERSHRVQAQLRSPVQEKKTMLPCSILTCPWVCLKECPNFPCQVLAGMPEPCLGKGMWTCHKCKFKAYVFLCTWLKERKKSLCPHEDLKFITYSRKVPAFRIIKCVELEYCISYCRKHNYTWFHSLAFGSSAQKYCLSRMPCHPLLQGNTHGTSPQEMEIY